MGRVADKLDIQTVPVDRLTPHPDNPRRGDVDAIRASIRANGFYGTLVAQASTGHILVGNHRYAAAVAEGFAALPVHYVDVDDTTALRILAADNRSADLAGYDERALAVLLEELSSTDDLIGSLYSADDVAELLATSGLAGERESAFLDDLSEGGADPGRTTAGGEITPPTPIPRQLIIAATPEERTEIVDTLRAIQAAEDLPTMTAALLWVLRQVKVP